VLADERVRKNAEHLATLAAQKEAREAAIRDARAREIAAEDVRRAAAAAEVDRIRALRERKLAELQGLGVAPVYTNKLKGIAEREMVPAARRSERGGAAAAAPK
jgi:hypothetical protein